MTRSLLDILGDFCRTVCGCGCPEVYIVPVLGRFRDQSPHSGGPGPPVPPVPTPNRVSPIKGRILVAFQLGSSQEVSVSVKFLDKRGNPAQVDDVPEWLVDNSELLSLEPSEDGLSCVVRAVGPLGTANVTLSADADLGEGSTPIIGTLEVEVTAGAATVVELVPGEPAEQATV